MRDEYADGLSLYTVSYVNFCHQGNDISEALVRLEKSVSSMDASGGE